MIKAHLSVILFISLLLFILYGTGECNSRIRFFNNSPLTNGLTLTGKPNNRPPITYFSGVNAGQVTGYWLEPTDVFTDFGGAGYCGLSTQLTARDTFWMREEGGSYTVVAYDSSLVVIDESAVDSRVSVHGCIRVVWAHSCQQGTHAQHSFEYCPFEPTSDVQIVFLGTSQTFNFQVQNYPNFLNLIIITGPTDNFGYKILLTDMSSYLPTINIPPTLLRIANFENFPERRLFQLRITSTDLYGQRKSTIGVSEAYSSTNSNESDVFGSYVTLYNPHGPYILDVVDVLTNETWDVSPGGFAIPSGMVYTAVVYPLFPDNPNRYVPILADVPRTFTYGRAYYKTFFAIDNYPARADVYYTGGQSTSFYMGSGYPLSETPTTIKFNVSIESLTNITNPTIVISETIPRNISRMIVFLGPADAYFKIETDSVLRTVSTPPVNTKLRFLNLLNVPQNLTMIYRDNFAQTTLLTLTALPPKSATEYTYLDLADTNKGYTFSEYPSDWNFLESSGSYTIAVVADGTWPYTFLLNEALVSPVVANYGCIRFTNLMSQYMRMDVYINYQLMSEALRYKKAYTYCPPTQPTNNIVLSINGYCTSKNQIHGVLTRIFKVQITVNNRPKVLSHVIVWGDNTNGVHYIQLESDLSRFYPLVTVKPAHIRYFNMLGNSNRTSIGVRINNDDGFGNLVTAQTSEALSARNEFDTDNYSDMEFIQPYGTFSYEFYDPLNYESTWSNSGYQLLAGRRYVMPLCSLPTGGLSIIAPILDTLPPDPEPTKCYLLMFTCVFQLSAEYRDETKSMTIGSGGYYFNVFTIMPNFTLRMYKNSGFSTPTKQFSIPVGSALTVIVSGTPDNFYMTTELTSVTTYQSIPLPVVQPPVIPVQPPVTVLPPTVAPTDCTDPPIMLAPTNPPVMDPYFPPAGWPVGYPPGPPLPTAERPVASPVESPSSEVTDGALRPLTQIEQLIIGVVAGGVGLIGLAVGLGVGLRKRREEEMERRAAKDMRDILKAQS